MLDDNLEEKSLICQCLMYDTITTSEKQLFKFVGRGNEFDELNDIKRKIKKRKLGVKEKQKKNYLKNNLIH